MDEKQYQQSSQKQQTAREKQQAKGKHAHSERHDEAHGGFCPNCGALITATCELCPQCGKPVDDTHCSFCGTEFEGNEPFCSECGSPRTGIKCPKCGSLSFRSFCQKCNTPLNDNAFEALEAAKSDPKFQKAQQLNMELANMESYLYRLKEEIEQAIAEDEAERNAPNAPGLSAEGEKLRAQYAQIMQLLGQQAAQPKQAQAPRPQPKSDRKREMKIKFHDAEMIMEAYRRKQAQMEDVLKSMLPDSDMTPAQQRDFCCARKVATVVIEKAQQTTWWVCNFCGCYHRQPSECVEPWHGGTWLHEEIEIEKKVWNYIT